MKIKTIAQNAIGGTFVAQVPSSGQTTEAAIPNEININFKKN